MISYSFKYTFDARMKYVGIVQIVFNSKEIFSIIISKERPIIFIKDQL